MSRSGLAATLLVALSASTLVGCSVDPAPVSTAGRSDISPPPSATSSATPSATPRAKAVAEKSPTPTPTPSPTTEPTPTADPTPADGAGPRTWVRLSDAGSGLGFALPRLVRPVETRDAEGPKREYTVSNAARTITVSVGELPADADLVRLHRYVDQLEADVAAYVQRQPVVSDEETDLVAGRPTVSETLTFPAGDGAVSLTRLRVVGSGRTAVAVAVVVNGLDEAAAGRRSARVMDRVVAELRYP